MSYFGVESSFIEFVSGYRGAPMARGEGCPLFLTSKGNDEDWTWDQFSADNHYDFGFSIEFEFPWASSRVFSGRIEALAHLELAGLPDVDPSPKDPPIDDGLVCVMPERNVLLSVFTLDPASEHFEFNGDTEPQSDLLEEIADLTDKWRPSEVDEGSIPEVDLLASTAFADHMNTDGELAEIIF
ncbi:MAG: hypothetical protein GJ677_10725 [Rhodobacteraceae bacterium]|nr:hypothetical protein [Paracoccaceae bacterium]